jgi:hypothetical protein
MPISQGSDPEGFRAVVHVVWIIRRGQQVADPNRTSGTFFTRVASVLPSEPFGLATGLPLRRFATRT